MNKKVAISVKGITKTFRIPKDKGTGVKSKILGRASRGYREFTPLRDITFDIYEGDFFGIVGRNGSGKSTLLKTIAGIYEPTAGRVKVNGNLVPFIELGVGFNPNLTGRENVYLNAALLGFSREETDEMYDDIVEFAELHDFMEERLQNYSSGMQVRLAFSISIRASGDILLLDEVLAVGDTAFQQKCFDYFEQLKREKRTVVLVTHSMANVERFCNRGILLNEGSIEVIGTNEEVASAYRRLFKRPEPQNDKEQDKEDDVPTAVKLSSIQVLQNGETAKDIIANKPFTIRLTLAQLDKNHFGLNVSIYIRAKGNILLFSTDTMSEAKYCFNFDDSGKAVVEYTLENIFTNGEYRIGVVCLVSHKDTRERIKVIDNQDAKRFKVDGIERHVGSLVHPPVDIELKNINLIKEYWEA